jgi:hypothetical protein
MPILNEQPINPNQLTQNKFRFVLQRAPSVEYFSAKAELPGITLQVAQQQTPFNPIPRPGNKMSFEPFPLTFRVDEDMRNYLEIFSWLTDLGFPSGFDGYNHLARTGAKEVSDASLFFLSSANNPNVEARFIDMFPVSLSSLNLDLSASEVQYLTATVVFEYQRYYIEKTGEPHV